MDFLETASVKTSSVGKTPRLLGAQFASVAALKLGRQGKRKAYRNHAVGEPIFWRTGES